jgi:hypothetical protein
MGLAHLAGHFMVISELKGSLVYFAMQSVNIDVLFSERNVAEFLNGFSLTMGLFMLAFGGVNVIYYFILKEALPSHKILPLFNAGVSFAVAVISAIFLLWTPVVVFGLAGLAYLLVVFLPAQQL